MPRDEKSSLARRSPSPHLYSSDYLEEEIFTALKRLEFASHKFYAESKAIMNKTAQLCKDLDSAIWAQLDNLTEWQKEYLVNNLESLYKKLEPKNATYADFLRWMNKYWRAASLVVEGRPTSPLGTVLYNAYGGVKPWDDDSPSSGTANSLGNGLITRRKQTLLYPDCS
ncbi:uncharacterized protein JCM6883_000034 [Sporobolomyces salmoneus]|uniref:uncharacterized protein n=1 Tax=Sporobolomyces salmoneus TaxID=183962 RepID=UPI00317B3335